MQSRDPHQALRSSTIANARSRGIEFVLAKLQWGKDQIGYSLHANPNTWSTSGFQPGTTSFTIGGFPSYAPTLSSPIFGNLVVGYGYDGHPTTDWNAVSSDPAGLGVLKTAGAAVPIDYKKAGYKSEAELINAMGRAANAASGGNTYWP